MIRSSRDIDVAVIGGGFAGLLCGAELKKAGVDDVRIIELGGDFGGVWYWNRYPGIQCDNESYCYIPLLEELDFIPSKKFADGAEIYEHCRRIGKHFGLYDSAIFSTQVRDLRWDDAIKRWRISTDRDDDIRARFVVMASGPFHRPKLPGIPGLTDFEGHSFHTSRWDYDYTGGDSTGGLDKLSDKRVALVGTGATGIQVTPFIARHAKHLYVFSAHAVVGRRAEQHPDRSRVGEVAAARLAEGAATQLPFLDVRRDGAGSAGPGLRLLDRTRPQHRGPGPRARRSRRADSRRVHGDREEEDYKVMERLRRRVEGVVDDKDTAETLKPYYRFLCKRPLSNDEYLASFNRPNVSLIDVSATKGVQRATEKGLIANDIEYEVDCIIYASGFEITTELSRRYSIDAIEGRGELALFDYWADGYQTLHGMTTRGFPNQFFTGFTQVGISANIAANYELQGEHIAYIIAEALARGATTVEPTQHAQDDWGKAVRDNAIDNSAFDAQCTPGYYNNEGGGGERVSGHTWANRTRPASTRSATCWPNGATRVTWMGSC